MFEWLTTEGASLKHHTPGQTNYVARLKDRGGSQESATRPFPNNPQFMSESILSEELRNEVYNRVHNEKKSLRAVSVELGIDMTRIAAVVRLVELENRQRKQVSTLLPLLLMPVPFPHLCPYANDESQKNRLVLKTPTWLNFYFLN